MTGRGIFGRGMGNKPSRELFLCRTFLCRFLLETFRPGKAIVKGMIVRAIIVQSLLPIPLTNPPPGRARLRRAVTFSHEIESRLDGVALPTWIFTLCAPRAGVVPAGGRDWLLSAGLPPFSR
jgi:hypothetical protein